MSSSNSRAGGHRGGPSSISALVSTLVPSIVLAAVLVGLFLVLRSKQRRLYAPRTYHDVLLEQYDNATRLQSVISLMLRSQ
jgi:hypothetical protein